MRLYLVRHAWAGERGDPRWPNDAERPLTADGKERFKAVAKKLAARGFAPPIIATSPYVRARQTAEILVKVLDGKTELVDLPALEPEADWGAAVEWAAGRDEDEIALVGHMPSLGELAAALVGASPGGIDLKKGAAAAIDFESRPAAGKGSLHWLVTAKILDC